MCVSINFNLSRLFRPNKIQSNLCTALVSRVLTSSQLLSVEYRLLSYHYVRFYTNRKSKSVCYMTGRARGFITLYGISRLTFKEYAMAGNYVGLRRFVW